ncbi:MAG: N-acetylneuraminate synthase family protein [Elusimicrobiota bacterium]
MADFKNLKKPYLIAEIGINHNGDLQIAKRLLDATFACGWDCAKFQKRNPDKCVPDSQKNIERETPWGRMTYLEYKKRMEFGRREYDYIDKYCGEKPLNWCVSIWDLDSLKFAASYRLPFLKIPSALLTDAVLLREACKSGTPIVLSTGMSTLQEIDKAVEILEKHSSQYVLMHCTSTYPSSLDELNLRAIPALRERYKCVVGYSGHEYGLDSTTVAVSMGAMVVERHITLDHSMWGTDQASSVEVQGMDKLYKQLQSVSRILGDGVKKVYPSEVPIREKLRGA